MYVERSGCDYDNHKYICQAKRDVVLVCRFLVLDTNALGKEPVL